MNPKFLVVTVLLLVGLAFLFVLNDAKEPTIQTESKLLIQDQPLYGNRDAKHHIVEFGDFKCPSCKMYHEKMMPWIEKEFIQTGKATFTFVNFPFLGQDSFDAAKAMEWVSLNHADKWLAYYHKLYDRQGLESVSWATPTVLLQTMRDVAITDVPSWEAIAADPVIEKRLQKDLDWVKTLKLTGTPSVLIDGKLITKSFDQKTYEKWISSNP